MLERDPQLEVLRAALGRAAAGEGSTAVVSGVAGIGKSTLLSAIAHDANERGFQVLRARGADLERTFAFGVVRSLFERALRRAPAQQRARLLSGAASPAAVALGLDPSPEAAVEDSPALLNAIYWLVDGLTRAGPTLLVVDDAHLADAPSLRALAFVAHRVDALALALLLGARDAEPTTDDAALAAIASQAIGVSLQGLSARGVRTMLERVWGTVSPATVDAVHHATGGTPFWVQQTAEVASRGSPRPGEAWSARALTAVVRGRLERTSDAARSVARAVAILGEGPEPRHVAALARLDPDDVLGAAAELAETGMFDPGPRIAFAHPSLAEAVVAGFGPHALSLEHLRAARVTRAAGASPEHVAGHLLRAPPTGDPENVDDLIAAGADALRRGAPGTAAEYLGRALAEPPTPEQDRAARALLGMSDLRLGCFAAASEHLAVAAEDPAVDVELVLALAFARGFAGEAGSLVYQLLEAAATQDDPERRLVLDSLARYWSWWIPLEGRPSIPLPPVATLTGATRGERLALAAYVLHGSCASNLSEAADLACRLLHDGRLARDGAAFTNPAGIGLVVLNAAERYEDFDRDIAHVEARAHASAAADAIYLLDLVRMQRHGQCGDLAASIETAARMARFAAAAPGAGNDLILIAATGWRLDAVLAREGPAAADEVLATCPVPDVLPPELAMAAPYLLAARALVHLACGRTELALADVEYRDAFIAERGGFPSPAGGTSRCRSRAPRPATRRALATPPRRSSRASSCGRCPLALAVALRAMARTDPGHAVALLEQALKLHRDGRMRLEHARTCVELGLAYRRRGQRRAARAVLERGADLAFACQAAPLLEQARVELRILGARPRRLAFSGVESLTASSGGPPTSRRGRPRTARSPSSCSSP